MLRPIVSIALMVSSLSSCSGEAVPPSQSATLNLGSSAYVGADDPRCDDVGEDGACSRFSVSIIDLLARPAAYDQQPVHVIGFVELQFEGNGIYLSEDQWARFRRNGLWIEVPDDLLGGGTFVPGYMIVDGLFDATETGHLGLWSGGIKQITRFEPWNLELER